MRQCTFRPDNKDDRHTCFKLRHTLKTVFTRLIRRDLYGGGMPLLSARLRLPFQLQSIIALWLVRILPCHGGRRLSRPGMSRRISYLWDLSGLTSQVDSAFYLPWDGKMSTCQRVMRWCSAAGKVTEGLAESNGSLPPIGWLMITCGLTACISGSVPGLTLGN